MQMLAQQRSKIALECKSRYANRDFFINIYHKISLQLGFDFNILKISIFYLHYHESLKWLSFISPSNYNKTLYTYQGSEIIIEYKIGEGYLWDYLFAITLILLLFARNAILFSVVCIISKTSSTLKININTISGEEKLLLSCEHNFPCSCHAPKNQQTSMLKI